MLIGTIALSVVQVCQLEVAYAVLFDVWSKSVKHQFLAPIGIRHFTLGAWIVGMIRGASGDFKGEEWHYQRAMALNPNDANVIASSGVTKAAPEEGKK